MESIAIYAVATVLIIVLLVVVAVKGRLDKAQWLAEKAILEDRLQNKEADLE